MKLPPPLRATLLIALAFVAGAQASTPTEPQSPGGDTSYTGEINRRAFSHPAASLAAEDRSRLEVGRGIFKRRWVAAPASVPTAADGLGPLFNARYCDACHPDNGRGRSPDAAGDLAGSMVVRLGLPPRTPAERQAIAEHRAKVTPDPTYGSQIQPLAITGQIGEGRPSISWREFAVTLGDGSQVQMRAPGMRILDLGFGPLDPETQLSARVAPPLIGLGLLESVAEADILSRADPDDADGDGISGRPNRVWSQGQRRPLLGRFGWKAGEATLDDQIQAAFSQDMGVSVPLHPSSSGDCTLGQVACREAPAGGDALGVEADGQTVEAVVFYTRNLAVPMRRAPKDPEVLAGEVRFTDIGCVGCHRPDYTTGMDARHPAQSGQRIRPYTDLLLHDLGEGLADRLPEGAASGEEWRTAPLWGIGLTPTVSGHSLYLHDGRARSLIEAILWHGGEAQGSRDAFAALPKNERDRVLVFLESL